MKKVNKKVIIIIAILLIVIIGLVIFLFNKKDNKVNEFNSFISKYDDCLGYLDINNNINDKYASFAVCSLYYIDNKNTFTSDEVKSFIKDTFNKKIKDEELSSVLGNVSIKGYTFNKESKNIIINEKYTKNEIAKINIDKYINVKSKKVKDGYSFEYQKYIVPNPYDILNYYTTSKTVVDIKEITNYLNGNKNLNFIKKYINKDNVEALGRKDKTFTVKVIKSKDKFYIEL